MAAANHLGAFIRALEYSNGICFSRFIVAMVDYDEPHPARSRHMNVEKLRREVNLAGVESTFQMRLDRTFHMKLHLDKHCA
jgi:hypothetical protein